MVAGSWWLVVAGRCKSDPGRCKKCADPDCAAWQILHRFVLAESTFREIRRARRVLLDAA